MITYLSLGAGVQSSCLAFMCEQGLLPKPKAAIFADTHAEPASVYRWLDKIKTIITAYPIVTVSHGNLTGDCLELHKRKNAETQWARSLLPVFTVDANGKHGMLTRACTYDYKIQALVKYQRKDAGIKRGQTEISVINLIGISADEAHRMKPSREKWIRNQYPLVEMGMTRKDCVDWMHDRGFEKPPRSSCVYCPFHSDHEWRRLKNEEPDEFAKAVQFEKDYQRIASLTDNRVGMTYWLHSSRKPLGEVDFRTDVEMGQGLLWGNECEGMCGL